MGTISVTLPADGDTIDAADVNNPINTLVGVVNGNIDSNNIAAGGVATSNLATGIQVSTKEQVPYKFSVYRTTAWTTGSSATLVAYDTKTFDTGTNIDVATNKGRFTAPVAGFYYFSASVGSATSNGGNNQQVLYLFKNGSNIVTLNNSWVPAVSNTTAINGSVLVQLAANDYVEIYHQDTFATAGVTGSINTWFTGFLVCAT